MEKQVSLYSTHADNVGRPATLRSVLLNDFARDFDTIVELRRLDPSAIDHGIRKKQLKAKLQCYTPAALMECKAKGQSREISRTGIMQLDFDFKEIRHYDLEELKCCVFALPFIALCSKSCSGDGFYALALIAEPHRLSEYAEHCFQVLKSYGIQPDESKGKKAENLRYVSYDSKMLIREQPEPLQIRVFRQNERHEYSYVPKAISRQDNDSLVSSMIRKVQNAKIGGRWLAVQQTAYTLGGIGDESKLTEIITAIQKNHAFKGQEIKYIRCARDCFFAGFHRPLKGHSSNLP